ncbi:hypothetical protein P7C70_g1900, partial [Phenoliferia sp. Uapishka_3]
MPLACPKCFKAVKSARGVQQHLLACKVKAPPPLHPAVRNIVDGLRAQLDDLDNGGFDDGDLGDGGDDMDLSEVVESPGSVTAYSLDEILTKSNITLEALPPHLSRRFKEIKTLKDNDPATSSYPFSDRLALEIALFAFQHAKLNVPNTQRLIDILDLIPNYNSPFANRDELLAYIDISPTDHISYHPRKVINKNGHRVVSDFMTANWAHQAQARHSDGVMAMGLICSSDEVQLAGMTGEQKAYPGFVSLGAFSNSVRADVSRGTTVELFSLPILHIPKEDREHPKWPAFLRSLVHQCLNKVFEGLEDQPEEGTPFYCPDGSYRFMEVLIAAWIADYKEQVRLGLILQNRCVLCKATRLEVALLKTFAPRIGAEADELRRQGLTVSESRETGIKPGISFTVNKPFLDAHAMFTLDYLHQHIKPFGDHLLAWLKELLDPAQMAEFHRRLRLMPHFTDLMHFPNGTDFHLQGKENKALMRIMMTLLDDLPGCSPSVIRSFRSYIEYGMSLRRHKHTLPQDRNLDNFYTPPSEINLDIRPSTTFELMEHQLAEYDQNRHLAFDDVVKTWILPREHSLGHGPSSVVMAGSGYGTTSDTPEHLNSVWAKKPWERTNKVDSERQVRLINQRLLKCEALSRVISGGGQDSLEDLAKARRRERKGKTAKTRSSRHQRFVEAWTKDLPFDRVFLSKRLPGRQCSLGFAASFYTLPFLVSSTASHLSTATTTSGSHTTAAERESSLRKVLSAFPIAISQSATIYTDVVDPTHEPDGEREYSKSIIRATSSWGYRDETARGGASYGSLRTRKPRYDHVYYQDTNFEGFSGIAIGRCRLLFVLSLNGQQHHLAYVEEYDKTGKDVASGLWRLKGRTKNLDKRTRAAMGVTDTKPRAAGRVINVEGILSAAHVVPRWGELHGRISRWNCFDSPGVKANLNHFIDTGTWDLVEDTALRQRQQTSEVLGASWENGLFYSPDR